MTSSKNYWLFSLLGYIGLNLILFGDVLFGTSGRVLSSSAADLSLHFAAWREFGFGEIQQGHLPLWNPHYLCGNPFLGNFESALLYPPNWVHLFLPLGLALNLDIVLHVVLAGFFTYLWGIKRQLSPLASFLAGTVFMWGGAYYLHLYAGHLPNLCAMAWAPLIFLSMDGILNEGGVRWVLLGVFAVSFQVLAGHPQYVYFTGLMVGFYFLLSLIHAESKLNKGILFFSVYGGAFFVTAAQSWTGLEALLHSARHGALELAESGAFSFPPQNLLTLFMPEFFGRLDPSEYWSSWYFWEGSLFIGLSAFFLVLCAFQSPQRRWLLTMVVISFLFSLGAYTPLYQVLYHCFPFWSGMRGMSKFVFLTSLFLSLLAGMGFDAWVERSDKFGRQAVLFLGTALIFFGASRYVFDSALNGPTGWWSQYFSELPWLSAALRSMKTAARATYITDRGTQAAWSLLEAGGIMIILSALCYWATLNRKATYGVAFLVILELVFFAGTNRPTFNLPEFLNRQSQLSQFFIQHPGDERVYGTAALAMVSNGSDIWEDEPIIPERYAQFVCYTQGIPDNKLFSTSPVFSRFGKVFELTRLKYLFTSTDSGFKVNELGFDLMPRMILYPYWFVLNDAKTELGVMNSQWFNPFDHLILEKDPGLKPALSSSREGSDLQWIERSTDAIEVKVHLSSPRVLLVTDNYDPGWKAEPFEDSSQKKYQVVPGDYFLRAVPLQTGYQHFTLVYRPWAFEVGKWVSLLSCLFYVAILVTTYRLKKSMESPTIP